MTNRDPSFPDIVVSERLTRVEEKLDYLTRQLREHVEKDSNLFYRYGWPLIQILIWIVIAVVLSIRIGGVTPIQ